MSRGQLSSPDRKPLIAVVDRANRALQADMVRSAHRHGFPEIKPAHNAVFATLGTAGGRAIDMAERAGITRQSMGEVIREMVGLGILEMRPDPADRRAKLVTYTEYGLQVAGSGKSRLAELEQRFDEEFGAAEYELARDVLQRLAGLLDRLAAEEAAVDG
ncbi:MarR family winged helix-turn-helix transcriptional regulator [Kribbella sp. CA-293567]|uniref:MarR family winged helix-turn-helix transcriptional regulator n=1 Tax=Kribbella sp. CA-293567 TaxID=3002436 RepID=UPI0022DE616F|nr:MarR family winged helix-turn-helix transcriptional regulator [Kribbella sp. CA-293567]WBQ03146.1 MarR family winged helix-turn-helix transcriptional regulator [Kribbella sp. CA-293567]